MSEQLILPAGFGFKIAPKPTWNIAAPETLMNRLIVWEPPRRGHTYIVAVDVAEGIGQDRSVADVLRVGTLKEPDEQVAQFITDSIDAVSLAAYLDAIGRLYKDDDGCEALMAIECNMHGMSTQSQLQGHYGYANFYIWEYYDAADPSRRFSSKIGWYTSRRTRPEIISILIKALNSYLEVDPSNPARTVRAPQPEMILNSPFTVEELQDFQIPPGGTLVDARATTKGTHDDCIMACAISLRISMGRHFSEREPLSEQRRRLAEEKEARDALSERMATRRDWQNTASTVDEMHEGITSESPEEWIEYLPESIAEKYYGR